MKRIFLLCSTCMLTLSVLAGNDKGNQGHGKGNGGNLSNMPAPAELEEQPGEVPGDPDADTNVPVDNGVLYLVAGVVVWAAYKSWQRRYQQPREINL